MQGLMSKSSVHQIDVEWRLVRGTLGGCEKEIETSCMRPSWGISLRDNTRFPCIKLHNFIAHFWKDLQGTVKTSLDAGT